MSDDVKFFSTIVAVVLLLVSTLFVVIYIPARQISHHVDVSVCRTFGQTTGRETRFMEYNWFNWECLVKTPSGKWITKDNLREVND